MQQNYNQQFILEDDENSSGSDYIDSSDEEWYEWSDIETDGDSGYESSASSITSPEYSDLDD